MTDLGVCTLENKNCNHAYEMDMFYVFFFFFCKTPGRGWLTSCHHASYFEWQTINDFGSTFVYLLYQLHVLVFLVFVSVPCDKKSCSTVKYSIKTARDYFRTPGVQQARLAFRRASTARAHSMLTRRQTITECRTLALEAGQLKGFPAVFTLWLTVATRPFSCCGTEL